MATQATQMPSRRQMQEVKAPDQFTFTKLGQTASGILLAIEPVPVKGKQAMEYLFQADGGGRFTCLGTADLDKKLNPNLIGHFVEITYEKDNNSFTKPGQNAMKIFRVTASKEKEPGY